MRDDVWTDSGENKLDVLCVTGQLEWTLGPENMLPALRALEAKGKI